MACIDLFKRLSPDIHNYLREKAGVDFDPRTGEGKEAWVKAAKELQEHTLNSLHDIYHQAGVKGYEQPAQPIVSEKVKNKLSQLKSKQNASTQSQGQQQIGDQQSSLPEYARTEQAGSEGKTTGPESSHSNKRGEGGQEEVTKEGAVEKAAPLNERLGKVREQVAAKTEDEERAVKVAHERSVELNKRKVPEKAAAEEAKVEPKPTEEKQSTVVSDNKSEIDVYDHQDKNAERIISEREWSNNVWRYKFENAGDILRELAKYKNQFLDPSYIYEKVNKIEEFITKAKKDAFNPNRETFLPMLTDKDTKNIADLKKAYEEQPVMSEAQEQARQLALNMIDGKLNEAQKQIDYFNKLREGDTKSNLHDVNKYKNLIDIIDTKGEKNILNDIVDSKELDNQVENLYNKKHTQRYSGNDKIFQTHKAKLLPSKASEIKEIIREKLNNSEDVRTGYTSTSIRGVHRSYIFYKDKAVEQSLPTQEVTNKELIPEADQEQPAELKPKRKPREPREPKPTIPQKRFTQKISEKASSELGDLFDELSNLANKQGITPNPEDEVQKSLLSLRIVAKATEAGIYKFADIVALGLDKLGAKFDALFTYVRDAYLAYQGRASDEVLDQMDNTKEVRNFDYEQFKNKDGNDTNDTITSDTDGSPSLGVAGNKQPGGIKRNVSNQQTTRTPGESSGVGQQNRPGTNEEGEEPGGSTGGSQGNINRPGSTTKRTAENVGQGVSPYQEQTGRLKPLPTNPADRNHIIEPSDTIVPEGNPAKVTANMDAVILLRQLEAENRNATPEEKKTLAKFVGWGGLAGYLKDIENDEEKSIVDNIFLGTEQKVGGYYNGQVLPAATKLDTVGKSFDEIAKELQRRYNQIVSQYPNLARYLDNKTLPLDAARSFAVPYLMNAAEFQAAGASTINAHYTDRTIITPIWDLIKKLGFTGGNVLESSAGVGHFFGLMPKGVQDNSNLTGVELDSLTGRILKKLYPDANIQVKGFETTNFPNNSFDLAVSNVPFAKEGLVTDLRNKDIDKFNLHNYFIAKNLKQLKPGGIAVMITSKSTMDNAVSAKARRWFLSPEGGNSELIGAVRLPNNAFDKNAATQVTTDIMVFQKRKDPIVRNTNPFAATELIRSEVIDGEAAEINLNEYYVAHPENMIGEMKYAFEVGSGGLYGKTDATLHAKPGTDIGAKVKELFNEFPTDILDTDYSQADTNISTNTKPGKMFMENGKVYVSNGEQGIELFLKPEQKKIALAYIGVRDAVRDLVTKELTDATESEIEADRAALNKIYDAFVKKHGTINKNGFLYDFDIEFSIAAAAEDVKETTIINPTGGRSKKSVEVKKAAIFTKRLNFPRSEPDTAENLSDAIQISLAYRNNIDPEYIGAMMGLTPAEAVESMIDKKLVFQNPTTALFETPEEYLSGNVRKKYNEAKDAASTDANYMRNVIELEKIQPEDKAISQIPFKMGVAWIQASMYVEFIREKLGVEIPIAYLEKAGIWALDKDHMRGGSDSNNTTTYAVSGETGIDIVSDIMANRSTVINDRIPLPGGGYSIRKNEAMTEAANQMQNKIVDEFRQWIATHETYGKEIERSYNDKFNNLVEKQYSAPPFDHFPGASTAGFKLRQHQLKAILRGLSGNPLLLAHSVGTGKTAIMQTTAMEWRRLKTSKKPLIVVQNSTLKDFAAKFHKLYPGANLLVSSEADKGEAERRRFYARISQGDWDAIIIPQSQFDRIPDNPDRVAAFLQERIAEMQEVLNNSDDHFIKNRLKKEIEGLQEDINMAYMTKEEIAGIKTQSAGMYVDEETGKIMEGEAPGSGRKKGGKQKVKAAAERLLKLNARVQKQAQRRTDNVMYFEDMGVDGLIVDEAHEYKKLGFQTGLQNIRGIDTGASKRALGLKLKVDSVKERTGGKNIVFATGTPITNTMAESWTMMRFLQPEVLEEMGIQYFDQFAATFTEVVPSLEQNAGGRFEVVERMKEFVNAKQLQGTFKKMADVVTTDDIPEFVSDPENAPPALKGGGFEMVLIPISKPMASTMRRLSDHYDWWKSLTGNEKKELSYLPLVLYQIAKKASIDLRLIDPRLEDDPESKVNYAVKNALKIYKQYDQYKGTQMIFSDSFQSGNSEIVHQILNVPAGLKPFNLYEDIKIKLIEGGVPASEIIVMSDVKTDAGKLAMQEKMNSGAVRFVIGSTAKMGIGVNAHERMVALHHIDAPDRPDQFTQRNGRLLRPGNMFTKLKIPVQILTYGIKDTRDATSYGRLRDKEKFVSDFMSGKGGDRVEDTGEEDEAGSAGDFFSEMSAQLSGSKYATELIFAEKELRTERNKATAFKQRREESEFKLHNKISGREEIKAKIKTVDDILVKNKRAAFPDSKITSLEIGGKEVHEKLTEALDKLIDETAKEYQVENLRLAKEAEEAGLKSRKIPKAKLGKFKINGLEANYIYEKPYEHLDAQSRINIPSLELNKDASSAASVLSVVRNYIKDIDDQPQRYRELLKKEEHNIETLKKNLAETYDFDKLEEIETRVSRLKAAVLAESKAKEETEKKEVADKKEAEKKLDETKKSFADKAREVADKIEKEGLNAALPDWAKATLPEGTELSSFAGNKLFDKAVAKAIRLVADAIEAGQDFANAIKVGFEHLKEYYSENVKYFDENKVRESFIDHVSGIFEPQYNEIKDVVQDLINEGNSLKSIQKIVTGELGDTQELKKLIGKAYNKLTETPQEEPKKETPKPEPEQELIIDEEEGPLRKFTKQVLTDEAILPKGRIAEKLVYVRQTNAMSIEEATDIINQIGVDAAWDLVLHDKELNGAVRSVLGQMLIRKFNNLAANATDEETRNYYIDKTVEAADYVTEKLATDAGQQIQAFKLYQELSPEAQLRSAIKDIKKQAEARTKRRNRDLLRLARDLNRINEEVAEVVINSASVGQAVENTEKTRVERAEDKIQRARDRRQKLIEQHKANKGQNLYSAVPGLTSEGIEFVGNLAKTYLDEGLANLEVIAGKIIDHLKNVTGKDVDAITSSNIRDIVQPLVEKVENENIATGLKDLEKSIHEQIRQHYTISGETKNDLINRFMEQAGLEREDAFELARSIQAEFDKIATRKKEELFSKDRKRLDRITKGLAGAKTIERKTLEDEIIRLSNLGTVDNETLLKLLADKLGTGKLSPEQGKRILFLAERIKNAPEGAPKREAVEDLLVYRAKLKGTSWGEVAQGVWYANVLSGYLTHIKNIVSTFFNGFAFFTVQAAKDPKSIPFLLYGGTKGFKRGGFEAWHTLTTGRSPIHIYKVETPNVLELTNFKGGVLNPVNYLKYVGRMMIAEDVLQFQGLKEMRATQLAYREAKLEGHRNPFSKATWEAVNEKLLNTKERLEEAEEQAEEEGFTDREARRRIYELMELSRPVQMTNDAYGFAAKGTFNHDTEGTLGALTDAVARLVDSSLSVGGAKPLRFVIPFTRIITNVANNALDYSPLGFVRAGFGRRGLLASAASGKRREMTPEERRDAIVKASLGIASMAALYGLAKLGLIAISGAGPDDYKKRQQLVEEGWQPYSIKIGDKWYSYKLTPMVFAWGIVGSIRDNEEYGREDDQTAGKRLALAAWDGVKLISDMTWINSAAPVMSAVSSGNPNEAGAIISNSGRNIAKGFFLPNAFTQGAERVEQIFKVPQKQANNMYENLIMNVPIARNTLNDKINALGDPIVKDVDILVSSETTDPVWKFLLDKKGWVAPVNKNTLIVFDLTTRQERPINNDEYYTFSKSRGQKMRGAIQHIINQGVYTKINDKGEEVFTINPDDATGVKSAESLTNRQLNKVLTLYETQATKDTKKELNYNEPE